MARSPYHRATMRNEERMMPKMGNKMPSMRAGAPSPMKAKKMLRHGVVQGKKITPKQQRFFGAVAGKAKMH